MPMSLFRVLTAFFVIARVIFFMPGLVREWSAEK